MWACACAKLDDQAEGAQSEKVEKPKEVNPKFRQKYCIYKWCSQVSNHLYVGHTKNFEKRKKEHLKDAGTKENKLYEHTRATGIKNWEMVIVDNFFACNRAEAEEREQEWMTKLRPTLNMCAAQS